MATSQWTPIVELQTGQAVSDKLDSAFGNIDDGLDSINNNAAELATNIASHGVVNPNTPLLSTNVDTTKYEIAAFDYYIQGVKYSYGGSVQNGNFGQAGDFIDIGVDASGLRLKINGFFTPEELKTILEIGRIASSDGTNVTGLGDSAFFSSEYMQNLYIRFKSFEGARFFNGTAKATENIATPFTFDIEGGNISTANMQKQNVNGEISLSGSPVYSIGGTSAIRTAQTPLIANNTQYDNGTDLAPIPSGEYVSHTLFRSSGTGAYYLEYGRATYARLSDAKNQPFTNYLFDIQGAEVEPLAKVIVQEGAANITQLIDIRNGREVIIGTEATQAEEVEFRATSLAVSQEPSGTDTPLQIEFGAAQSGNNATIDAAGNITILTEGEYHINAIFHFGRTGGAGVAELFGRRLLNGVQMGESLHSKVDDSDVVSPLSIFAKLYFQAGDVITHEILRDSGGVNSGGLFQYQPALAGWNNAPTATVTVIKHQG